MTSSSKRKSHVVKLCQELNLQRNCLVHVENFANFLKAKTTFTITQTTNEFNNELLLHDDSLGMHMTTNNQQQIHYYPSYDDEFQAHHQKFDRDFRYYRSKCLKLQQKDSVSSLYDILFDLYENCHVIDMDKDRANLDGTYHKTLFDIEILEREQLSQQQISINDLETLIDFDSSETSQQQQQLVLIETAPVANSTDIISISETFSSKSSNDKIKMGETNELVTQVKSKKKKKLINHGKRHQSDDICSRIIGRRKKAEKGNFHCPMVSCNRVYKFKDNLLKHLLQHVEVKTEVLGDESVKLPRRKRRAQQLDDHTASSSTTQPNRHQTRRRKATSSGNETIYKCDFDGCDYTAPYRSALDLHKVKHSNDRPFKCQHCEKSFKQIYALKMHEMIHSGQQFQCPFTGCSAIYSWIYSLKKHMRIHTNQAPIHRCEWPACEYQTHRQDLLRKHMTRHTGERLFNCTWVECGKSFKTRSGLYDHLLMHKNERKQVCNWPGCNYRCNLPGNLRKHIAIHEKKVIKLEPIADPVQISFFDPSIEIQTTNQDISSIVDSDVLQLHQMTHP
ncbi:hypothetical protein BLOT_005217 [Blomia tropicalis]|nr:hypothetical protein BLOT_005217 [Blomia tropicalis]